MENETTVRKKKRIFVVALLVILVLVMAFSAYIIYMFWPIWRAERMAKELHEATAYEGIRQELYDKHPEDAERYYFYYDAMRHFPAKYSKKELKEKLTDKRSKRQFEFYSKQYKNFEYSSDYSSIYICQFKFPWDAKKALEDAAFFSGERYYYDKHELIDDKTKFRVGYAHVGITGASNFLIEGFARQGNCYIVYSTMIDGESLDPKYQEMIQKECEMLALPDPFMIMENY